MALLPPYTDAERQQLREGTRRPDDPTYWGRPHPGQYDPTHRQHSVWFVSTEGGQRVTLRLRGDAEGGVACAAVTVERTDGRSVTARDLRAPIGPLLALLPALAPWFPSPPSDLPRPARPGPRGHGPDHWRRVMDLWVTAQRLAPGREVTWMTQRFQKPYPVSQATMRRWRDRAVAWAAGANYVPGQSASVETDGTTSMDSIEGTP